MWICTHIWKENAQGSAGHGLKLVFVFVSWQLALPSQFCIISSMERRVISLQFLDWCLDRTERKSLHFVKEKITNIPIVPLGGIWMDYLYLKGKEAFNLKKKREEERKEKRRWEERKETHRINTGHWHATKSKEF